MPDDDAWYYSVDGETSEPVTLAALRMMIRRGDILPEEFVFRDGWEQWAPAGDIEVLWAEGNDDEEEVKSDKPIEALLDALVDGSGNRPSDEEVLDLVHQSVETVKQKQFGAWEELGSSAQGAVLAMVSLVCGVLCMVGWLSIPGIAAGYYALQRLDATSSPKKWRRIAIGGIVLNVFAFILFVSSFIVS